jgi:hypothetical protein
VVTRQLPTCARCDHEVDSVGVVGSEDGDVLILVKCHGEIEQARLPLLLFSAPTIEVRMMRAFVDRPASDEARIEDDPDAERRRRLREQLEDAREAMSNA